MSTEKRRRLPPEERKRQLVAIGLQELATRPIHALSVDRVAEIAGISRGLLFRYFPTKQDFYVAVVAAAARRLLRAAVPDPDDADPLRAVVQPFVAFIDRHGRHYQAFFHGGFGTDPQIRTIHENMRNTMVERTVAAIGVAPTPLVTMQLRGWWSLVESMAMDRLDEPSVSVDDVVDCVTAALAAWCPTPGSGSSRPAAPRSAAAPGSPVAVPPEAPGS
ncbi:TetR/AcrR family transcriptional regulator [Rhodococcus ruber]|uniref:TetR/AcrR family transcriptional regulator n=1 Tax=Rhodococcus TaxID=1827 RepID=UPI000C7D9A75|nr:MULTISPECIES: TetR/AcrR family transcriptional regulator [Rhodococcus]AUM19022.1 TetR family transcriptional regulator [Rhodococcus ruber]QRE79018.1 TetR/AcrR family transcriptional regulator [Rhodococcus ruber]